MHWSYVEIAGVDLAQGDILLPNDALTKVLQNVHRWFTDPKYLGFIVISQTCDLVRRDGSNCKSPYIEIAVVRPLGACLLQLLKQQCQWIGDRYFPDTEKKKAGELLERIINQNEATLGLFYLHPDFAVKIVDPAVALLRVSVALRSVEHYETLIGARTGRLHPEFANKLGWLCGNLYSRVGIKEWSESEEDRQTALRIKQELLDNSDGPGPKFVKCSKGLLQALAQGTLDLRESTDAQVKEALARYDTRSFQELAIEAVCRALADQRVDAGVILRVRGTLKNDADFNSTLKKGKE